MAKEKKDKGENRYKILIEKVYFDRYKEGANAVEFERGDLVVAAQALGIKLPKNLGDVVYSVRYRTSMPDSVLSMQPKGMEWIIEGVGRSRYVYRLVPADQIDAEDLTAYAVRI